MRLKRLAKIIVAILHFLEFGSVDCEAKKYRNYHMSRSNAWGRRLENQESLTPLEVPMNMLEQYQNPWENSGQYEGDIYFPIIDDTDRRFADTIRRWPGTEIPYEIDRKYDISERKTIIKALDIVRRETCLQPRPRNVKDNSSILFQALEGRGCYSSIGTQNILQQPIYLDPAAHCVTTDVVIHEFLHAAGFVHEVSAPDRDRYVKIIWDNIKTEHQHNFDKLTKLNRFGTKYDYNSIMHYSAYAFSKNGKPTILSTHSRKRLTRNIKLSRTDVLRIKKMYKCRK